MNNIFIFNDLQRQEEAANPLIAGPSVASYMPDVWVAELFYSESRTSISATSIHDDAKQSNG